MQMIMIHVLENPIVLHDRGAVGTERCFQCPRDFLSCCYDSTENAGIHVCKLHVVLFRYNEHVAQRNRIFVQEAADMVILIYNLSVLKSFADPAE